MSGADKPEPVAAATALPALPKSRGTGFEPYFADAPMTPEEAQLEKEQLYSPDRPIHERMEECVQRFRRRRRFPINLGQYFDHYLFLGGIDSSQRHISSLASASAAELDLMSPEEICDLTTAKMVRDGGNHGAASKFFSPGDDEHWDVDFTGVVAGFLSDALPGMTGQDYTEMCRAVDVVENFLRYVLHHDACPEHADDVRAAAALCERARLDLPAAHAAHIQFPGQFNLAAAELFLNDHSGHYVREDADGRAFRRPDGFDAESVFKTGVMLAGTLANMNALQRKIEDVGGVGSIRVLCEEERDLEVISIHPPSDNVRKQFKAIRLAHGKPAITPVGTAIMKPCQIDDGWDAGEVVASQPIDDKTQLYLLDERILRFMQPGMKLRLKVCDLDIGLTFVEQAMSVLVPWYTFLPQTLMQGFKEPRPNDKPAPSVQNPDVEEANSDEG